MIHILYYRVFSISSLIKNIKCETCKNYKNKSYKETQYSLNLETNLLFFKFFTMLFHKNNT